MFLAGDQVFPRSFVLLSILTLSSTVARAQVAMRLAAGDQLRITTPALAPHRSPLVSPPPRREAFVVQAGAGFGLSAAAPTDALVKLARLATLTLASDLSASFALSRRSAGLRITLRL